MRADVWTYRRELETSQARLAAFVVHALAPEAEMELVRGVVIMRLPRPWWALATLGLWRLTAGAMFRQRCREEVPRICGWCPEVRIK